MTERMFPVLLLAKERERFPNCPMEVPWDKIALHEVQVKKNHFQSLEQLAKRGGLNPTELMCALHDHDFIPGIKMEDSIMWLHGFMGVLP
jgi:hypothetical protein